MENEQPKKSPPNGFYQVKIHELCGAPPRPPPEALKPAPEPHTMMNEPSLRFTTTHFPLFFFSTTKWHLWAYTNGSLLLFVGYWGLLFICWWLGVRWKATRGGQKVQATILFLFSWVHLYKDGSFYIKYEPLSVIPPNMVSIACLIALQY